MNLSYRLLLILLLFPVTAMARNISIKDYKFEDYVRHPRMEEEDRLRNREFSYLPGLELISNIDDVEIHFFDAKIGRTPWEGNNLSPGSYRIRLERNGYKIVDFWLSVHADRRTVVDIQMERALGSLVLRKIPEKATISLNQKPYQGENLSLPSGPYTLEVKAFGWEPVQESIEILPNQTLFWTYVSSPLPFQILGLRARPPSLAPHDAQGFLIEWEAKAPGSAILHIRDPQGKSVARFPLDINTAKGSLRWRPLSDKQANLLAEGLYTLEIKGEGQQNSSAEIHSQLRLDAGSQRSPRSTETGFPGLLYSAGTSLLPPRVWQFSTGIGYHIDRASNKERSGLPVWLAFRMSPAKRWEIMSRLGFRARDPFENSTLSFSLSGSWRVHPLSQAWTGNLAFNFYYQGLESNLKKLSNKESSPLLPGLQLSFPMEYRWGKWHGMLSPSAYLSFLGKDPYAWRFSGSPIFSGGLGLGLYWENHYSLLGFSSFLRTADTSGDFLDWTLWLGLEGRINFPGNIAFLSLSNGLQVLPGKVLFFPSLEFGLVH